MSHSTLVPLITKGTHFVEGLSPDVLEYRPDINFVSLPDGQLKETEAHLLGYAPLPGDRPLPDYIRVGQLAKQQQQDGIIRSRPGKEGGAWLYNSPHAVAALAGYVGRIGAYMATIDTERMCPEQDTWAHGMPDGWTRIRQVGERAVTAAQAYIALSAVGTAQQSTERDVTDNVWGREAAPHVTGPTTHAYLRLYNPKTVLHGAGSLRTALPQEGEEQGPEQGVRNLISTYKQKWFGILTN